MLLIVIAHLCMISLIEINSQNVGLDELHLQTPCDEGLRHGIDTFYMNATIQEDFTAHVIVGWDTDISAEVLTNGALDFVSLCVVDIGATGELCGMPSPGMCYCRSIDNETGTVAVVISHVAAVNISEGIIRVKWEHSNGNVVYSGHNRTLPRVYDVHSAILLLKVNGNPVPAKTDCNYDVVPRAYNMIEVCCSNTATPCFPRVVIKQYTLAGNTSKCMRYQFMMHNQKFQSTMLMSYAVCSKDIYYQSGSCLATSHVKDEHGVNILIIIIFAIPAGVIVCVSGRIVYVVVRRLQTEGPDAPDYAGGTQYYGRDQP